MPWVKRGIRRLIPRVIWQPHPPIAQTLAEIGAAHPLLDLGAGGRQISQHIWGVDLQPAATTAVVANIESLPFASATVAGVFCTGALEHTAEPDRVLDEILRVLRPGGVAHLEVPFMQPYHADPADFWRWTLPGLRKLASRHGLEEIRSGTHLGPTAAMNELVIAYWRSWFCNRYLRAVVDIVLSCLIWPLRYLDALLPRDSELMPSGVFFVGRKPDPP